MIRDNIAYSRSGISDVVVHRHLRLVDEHAQPLAVIDQRAQRLGPARGVRQPCQLRLGVGEQAGERRFQRALRRVELPRLCLANRGVMRQTCIVEPVELRDALDPSLAPAPEPDMAGGTVEEGTSLVRPAPAQHHLAVELVRQALVGREAVAHQEQNAGGGAEQLHRDRGAARRVDVVVDRIVAERGPQPSAARPALLA